DLGAEPHLAGAPPHRGGAHAAPGDGRVDPALRPAALAARGRPVRALRAGQRAPRRVLRAPSAPRRRYVGARQPRYLVQRVRPRALHGGSAGRWPTEILKITGGTTCLRTRGAPAPLALSLAGSSPPAARLSGHCSTSVCAWGTGIGVGGHDNGQ